jgi:hypothetical protein
MMAYEEIKDDRRSQEYIQNRRNFYLGCFICGMCVIAVTAPILLVFGSMTSGNIVVTNDYDCDVMVTWVNEKGFVINETRLIPWQSNSYESYNYFNRQIVLLITKIYVNNSWGSTLNFAIPSGVYDATYTVSQLRGPQSNVTSTAMIVNVTNND